MAENNGDGRAYIAGWIVKLIGGILLTGSLAWANWNTATNNKQSIDIAVVTVSQATQGQQLSRIENKLDRIIEKLPERGGE